MIFSFADINFCINYNYLLFFLQTNIQSFMICCRLNEFNFLFFFLSLLIFISYKNIFEKYEQKNISAYFKINNKILMPA